MVIFSCRKVKIPLICAGGIADGRGLLAMLSLGADAVAMGSRLATTIESPLAESVKQEIVRKTESDTLYGKNFDGLYARVMKTDAAEKAMAKPMNIVTAVAKSFSAAKMINLPIYKLLPGLLLQFSQIYQLSLFGAATEKLVAATVRGDLEHGVQFVGQSQGLINDIVGVDELIRRCVAEAIEQHRLVDERFIVKK